MLLDLGLISAVAGEPKLAGDGPAGAVEGAQPISVLAEFRALVDALAASVPPDLGQNPDAAESDSGRHVAASGADAPSEDESPDAGPEPADAVPSAPPADVRFVPAPADVVLPAVAATRTAVAEPDRDRLDDRSDVGQEGPVAPVASSPRPADAANDMTSDAAPRAAIGSDVAAPANGPAAGLSRFAPLVAPSLPTSPSPTSSSPTSPESPASPALETSPRPATLPGLSPAPAEEVIATVPEGRRAPSTPAALLELDQPAPDVPRTESEGHAEAPGGQGRIEPDLGLRVPALRLVSTSASGRSRTPSSETVAGSGSLALDASALAAAASTSQGTRFAIDAADLTTGAEVREKDTATGEPAPIAGLSRTTSRLAAYVSAVRGSHSDPRQWAAGVTTMAVSVQPDAVRTEAAQSIWPALPVGPASTTALRGAETFSLRVHQGTGESPLPEGAARQIVQALRLQWSRGVGEAQIRLQPDHLGQLSVSLRVERGHVVARLEADAPVVREWLNANQATLKHSLAEHHLTLDRFEVAEPPAESAPEGKARHQQGDRDQAPRRRRRGQPGVGEQFEVVV